MIDELLEYVKIILYNKAHIGIDAKGDMSV